MQAGEISTNNITTSSQYSDVSEALLIHSLASQMTPYFLVKRPWSKVVHNVRDRVPFGRQPMAMLDMEKLCIKDCV
jgi:hypothetical protein